MRTAALLVAAAFALAAQPAADPRIAGEITRIQAFDNHAHPLRAGAGYTEYDALPVEGLAPMSDPVRVRPGNPEIAEAHSALCGDKAKQQVEREQGDGYPAWVLAATVRAS